MSKLQKKVDTAKFLLDEKLEENADEITKAAWLELERELKKELRSHSTKKQVSYTLACVKFGFYQWGSLKIILPEVH